MNLKQISERNIKLQKAATKITQLLPGGQIVIMTSTMIRSLKRMDVLFPKLLEAKTEMRFGVVMEKMEEEMDEVVYELDRMAEIVKARKFKPLEEFVNYGYEVLNIYSLACDKIIERRVNEEI